MSKSTVQTAEKKLPDMWQYRVNVSTLPRNNVPIIQTIHNQFQMLQIFLKSPQNTRSKDVLLQLVIIN